MNRRQYLLAAGGAALAGCLSGGEGGDGTGTTTDADDAATTTASDGTTTADGTDDGATTTTAASDDSLEGTLTVATYDTFVDAPSSSPGPWIKEEFERRHPGVTLEYSTPENVLNHYILRRQEGAPIDADVYLGLKVPELVRIDQQLSEPLFEAVDTGRLANYEHVREGTALDPEERVLPLFTGYTSLVYDGTATSEPETLDALASDEFEGQFTVQNPQTDVAGLYFLLLTVKAKGEDGYLDYWRSLVDNDVRVLESWSEAYSAFTAGETPIVNSYSNDRVYAKRADQNLEKHRIAFPDGHGYANLSGMGKFATSDRPDLSRAFVDFMLGPEPQGKLAELNVSFPVTDHADVPATFEEYAQEPPEPLVYTYDELVGNLETWRRDWERLYADS